MDSYSHNYRSSFYPASQSHSNIPSGFSWNFLNLETSSVGFCPIMPSWPLSTQNTIHSQDGTTYLPPRQEYHQMNTYNSFQPVTINTNANLDLFKTNNFTAVNYDCVEELARSSSLSWQSLHSDNSSIVEEVLAFESDLISTTSDCQSLSSFQTHTDPDASSTSNSENNESLSYSMCCNETTSDKKRRRFCQDCNQYFLNSGHLKRHYKSLKHQANVIGSSNGEELQTNHEVRRHFAQFGSNVESHVLIEQPEQVLVTTAAAPTFEIHLVTDDGQKIQIVESTPVAESNPVEKMETEATGGTAEYITIEQFYCEICFKTFKKLCYLKQHNNLVHSEERRYKCKQCGKRFTCLLILNKHIKKHSGEKPFKCTECTKSFNYKADLRRHTHQHREAQPFTCECGKGFSRKDHLEGHKATHDRKLEKKKKKKQI